MMKSAAAFTGVVFISAIMLVALVLLVVACFDGEDKPTVKSFLMFVLAAPTTIFLCLWVAFSLMDWGR